MSISATTCYTMAALFIIPFFIDGKLEVTHINTPKGVARVVQGGCLTTSWIPHVIIWCVAYIGVVLANKLKNTYHNVMLDKGQYDRNIRLGEGIDSAINMFDQLTESGRDTKNRKCLASNCCDSLRNLKTI